MNAKFDFSSLASESYEILRPLNNEEIRELAELYREKYSTSNFHFILMYNQLKWNKQLAQNYVESSEDDLQKWVAFRKSFYTKRGCDFRKYGTYISIHWDTLQSISCHSWEPTLNEIRECLTHTSLIFWKSGPLLTNVDLPLCEPIKQIAIKAGSSVQRARTCHGLILPHKKALELRNPSLPDGYTMKSLEPEHAEYIHSIWTNKKEGSLAYIEGLIKINQSLGIFTLEDNKLVAWIIQNDFAGLGFLQVLPSEQRKGLGSILAAQLSKNIAQSEEVEISVWIVADNYKSEGLLEKIGFEKYVINEWIQLNKND